MTITEPAAGAYPSLRRRRAAGRRLPPLETCTCRHRHTDPVDCQASEPASLGRTDGDVALLVVWMRDVLHFDKWEVEQALGLAPADIRRPQTIAGVLNMARSA